MGKIVKYCANCEESFAEKFSFCPNCAAALTAYEMNPVAAASPIVEPIKLDEPIELVEPVSEPISAVEPPPAVAPVVAPPAPEKEETLQAQTAPPVAEFSADGRAEIANGDAAQPKDETIEKPKSVIEPAPRMTKSAPITVIPAASVAPSNVEDYKRAYDANGGEQTAERQISANGAAAKTADKKFVGETIAPAPRSNVTNYNGGYNITFVEERDNGIRRLLLLGAFLFVTMATLSGVVYSLYTSDALVGSLEDQMALVAPVEDTTAVEPIEPEPPPKKNNDDGGGGGGGGNKAETETSKGRLATQDPKPQIPPSVTMAQVTNPELVLKPATQGNRIEKPSTEPYGNPNSLSTIPSDGTGSGGGQGAGQGRGQGNGRGTGAGNGIGSGNGNGIGNGNGNGLGDGDGAPPPIKVQPVGPTEAIKITSKPRANYTDAARQAQVQGTVTLRVTFLANGSIGSISTVSGLPNGLTEQAIAAARSMRFEPAKKGGVPYTVTKQVQYNFTLY